MKPSGPARVGPGSRWAGGAGERGQKGYSASASGSGSCFCQCAMVDLALSESISVTFLLSGGVTLELLEM